MTTPKEILAYGVRPQPGSIVYRESQDGALDIELVPKSAAQVLPQAAWALFCFLLVLGAVFWVWRRGMIEGWFRLMSVIAMLHVVAVMFVFLWVASRKRLHIRAGPEALFIWTTALGDQVHHSWNRAEIEQLSCSDDPEITPALLVHLKGRAEPVMVQIFRERKAVEEMVQRLRDAIRGA